VTTLATTGALAAEIESAIALRHPSFLPGDELVGQAASAMMAGYLAAASLLR
jgi:hypothetical protein